MVIERKALLPCAALFDNDRKCLQLNSTLRLSLMILHFGDKCLK